MNRWWSMEWIGSYSLHTPSPIHADWLNALLARERATTVKPGPHQQQCRSNIVECYSIECCFDIFVGVDRALRVYVDLFKRDSTKSVRTFRYSNDQTRLVAVTPAVSSRKRNVRVWRPSVRLSVCPVDAASINFGPSV